MGGSGIRNQVFYKREAAASIPKLNAGATRDDKMALEGRPLPLAALSGEHGQPTYEGCAIK